MLKKRICVVCGKEFSPKHKNHICCSKECGLKNKVKKRKENHNRICECCGKSFNSTNTNNRCCSQDCRMRYLHKTGKLTYYKCIEEERNIPSLKDWINEEHNIKNRTILDIASDLKTTRITVKRWCELWGIKTKTISEDSKRRYLTMTLEQKQKQTESANIAIRKMFKDDDWKARQIKKTLEAQNFNVSKPELIMRKCLIDHGYIDFVPQYQLGPFFIDIAFPDIKLAIEIDGEYWHSLPEVKNRDKRRNYYIKKKMGWEMLHIPAKVAEKQTKNVVFDIIQAVECTKNMINCEGVE